MRLLKSVSTSAIDFLINSFCLSIASTFSAKDCWRGKGGRTIEYPSIPAFETSLKVAPRPKAIIDSKLRQIYKYFYFTS